MKRPTCATTRRSSNTCDARVASADSARVWRKRLACWQKPHANLDENQCAALLDMTSRGYRTTIHSSIPVRSSKLLRHSSEFLLGARSAHLRFDDEDLAYASTFFSCPKKNVERRENADKMLFLGTILEMHRMGAFSFFWHFCFFFYGQLYSCPSHRATTSRGGKGCAGGSAPAREGVVCSCPTAGLAYVPPSFMEAPFCALLTVHCCGCNLGGHGGS